MLKKTIAAVGLATAATAVSALPASAHTNTVVCKATLTAHPENSSPVWAYDTFTRTTTFHHAHNGTWSATFRDFGTFTTVPGVNSDSGDLIQHKVTGGFVGYGSFAKIESQVAPKCAAGETWPGAGAPSTTTWIAHYFAGDVAVTLNDDWVWIYRTCREHMTETAKGVTGHIAGLWCRKPRHHHPKPTPTPTKSESPTPTPTVTVPAGDTAPPAQPVTGQPVFTG